MKDELCYTVRKTYADKRKHTLKMEDIRFKRLHDAWKHFIPPSPLFGFQYFQKDMRIALCFLPSKYTLQFSDSLTSCTKKDVVERNSAVTWWVCCWLRPLCLSAPFIDFPRSGLQALVAVFSVRSWVGVRSRSATRGHSHTRAGASLRFSHIPV